jgi:hypothetical protein
MYVTANDNGQLAFGETYSDELTSENNSVQWSFYVPKAGKVTINVKCSSAELGRTSVSWVDNSGLQIYQGQIISGGYNRNMDLEAGTYYIEISAPSNTRFGVYSISADYVPAENLVSRTNTTRDAALEIRSGQSVGGIITHQNNNEYYKIILTQAGKITVNLTCQGSVLGGTNVRLINEIGMQIQQGTIISGAYSRSSDVEAGTYYIEISQSTNGNTGAYSLTVTTSSVTPANNTITVTASPANSGTVTGGGTVQANASVTLTATPNTGWFFDGWYENGARVGTNANYTFTATANRTLEARFSQTITVSYDANGGVGAPSDQSKTKGTALTLSNTRPTRTGFEFLGWAANDAATAAQYQPGGTYTADESVTFYAVWNAAAQKPAIPNNHSTWATPELEKALEMDLIPLALLDPGVDYTKPITRLEFAGVAVKVFESLSGTKALPAVINPFTDTNDIDVLKAYNVGITDGTAADKFSPDALLTREQAATMLTRVFKRVTMPGWTLATDSGFALSYTKPAPFADDSKISAYAKDSVYFMFANEIISGIGNNMFAPRATTSDEQARGYAQATREQALAIAVRMVTNLR